LKIIESYRKEEPPVQAVLPFLGEMLFPQVQGYIMPSYPPGGIAGVFSFSGISVTKDSVVKIIEAMLAPFCKAALATLRGSTIPFSSY
jgi:hypothetical protein